jgi:DNA-binding protein H-NS
MTKTYAQLTREIQALQASAEKLRAAEVKAVIAKLNESIAAYQLTADDLHFPGSTSSGRRAVSTATVSSRTDVSSDAKYSDGQGNTWGGRGPRPAWLRQAISNGKSLESFETSGTAARSTKAAGGNAKSQSAASKIKLPPLYGHPKTGQTWSGRGPKPAWLKQGLKKRGTSIDDFLISASTSAPAKPAAAAPSTPAKKSLAEKVASRSTSAADSTSETAAKSASTAPARKTTGGKPAVAAGKTRPAPAAGATAAPAPAKKAAAKPAAKVAVKPAGKPAAKTNGAPRKNLPSSMAPSADAAPTPSTVPAAAPMPAPLSDSIEGRGEAATGA